MTVHLPKTDVFINYLGSKHSAVFDSLNLPYLSKLPSSNIVFGLVLVWKTAQKDYFRKLIHPAIDHIWIWMIEVVSCWLIFIKRESDFFSKWIILNVKIDLLFYREFTPLWSSNPTSNTEIWCSIRQLVTQKLVSDIFWRDGYEYNRNWK